MDQIPANPKVSICKGTQAGGKWIPQDSPTHGGTSLFGSGSFSLQSLFRLQTTEHPRHFQKATKAHPMNSQDTSNEQPRHNQGTSKEHATKRQRRKTPEEHEIIVAEPRHIQGTSNSCGTQAHPRSYPRHRYWLKVLMERPQPKPTEQRGVAHHFGDGGARANLRAISSGLTGFPLPLAWSTHRWLLFLLSCHCIFIH